ncbi:hypothetical protein WJX77_007542 [Trebouxia sp. C0004]
MAEALQEHADRYERLDLIGKGSFGDVYRGWDKELQREVAIKVIDLEDVEDDIEDIHKEVSVLAKCCSPNITEYFASIMLPGTTELLIIMELMATSLSDLLEDGPLQEATIAFVLCETVKALEYLHGEHRIHRDMKAANILLSAQGDVKISDFGVSGQLTGTLGYRRRTFVGTPYWMAPEVIESSEEGYAETADIWSLGITAIELATGAPPHADLHPMRVLFLIPKSPAPELEGPFSRQFKDFVAVCLRKDPSRRPTAQGLLQHDFLQHVQAPASLQHTISAHAAKRPPLDQLNHQATEYQQTMPRWNFGTEQAPPGAQPQPKRLGTLRSHQINMTFRDDGTVRHHTVAKHPSLAMMAQLAEAGLAMNGSRSSELAAADVMLETDTNEPLQEALPPSTTSHAMPTPDQQAMPSHVLLDPGMQHADIQALPDQARLQADADRPVHSHQPRMSTDAELPLYPHQPKLSGDASAHHRLAASWQQSEASMLEIASTSGSSSDSEWLRHLLEPALAATLDNDPAATAAASAALTALANLEGLAPGSLQTMMLEVLRIASECPDSSSLHVMKSQAQQLFSMQPEADDLPKDIPDLGTLGNYLLTRWRENIAHDHIQGRYPS